MTSLNVSLICLSLKYLSKNYNSIVNVSKWIYFELTKINYKESKFIKSLNKKDFEGIKILITFNENIDLLSKYLIEYCSYKENYFNIVKLLIDNGANVHAQDYEALMNASCYGYVDIVKLLIDNGANVHANDDQALKLAICNGHLEIVKLLIDNGADVRSRNDQAIIYASCYGHLDVVKLLIDNGADIHANHDQALRCTSFNGHLEVVKLLVENGADGPSRKALGLS